MLHPSAEMLRRDDRNPDSSGYQYPDSAVVVVPAIIVRMFSQTTEYALRIVVYLANLSGTPATIPRIAVATKIPEGYLAKVLRQLAIAGLVRSQRGLHGGSILARLATQISVLDVVQAVDPIRRIEICPLGFKGHGKDLCPLHRRLDEVIELVEKVLRTTMIAELVKAARDDKPFCDEPARRRKLTILRK